MDTCSDITILRKAEGLHALLSRRRYAFRLSPPPAYNEADLTFEDLSSLYEFVESPLQQPLGEHKQKLVHAWRRLMLPHRPDAQTLADLLVLLMETHATDEFEVVIHNHTVYRKDLHVALSTLHRHLPAAQQILNRAGYTNIPPEVFRARDPVHPCFAYYFALASSAASIPRELAPYLLPLLMTAPEHAPEMLRIVWNLGLRQDRNLLATICRMALSAGTGRALAWTRILESQLPNRRAALGALIVESGVVNTDPESCPSEYFEHLRLIQNKSSYIYRAWFLLQAIRKRTPRDYVKLGLSLASYQSRLPEPPERAHTPASLIRKIAHHTQRAENYYRSFPLQLLQACATVPGFEQVMRGMVGFQEFSPDDCVNYLEIFLDFDDRNRSLSPKDRKLLLQLARLVWLDLKEIPLHFRKKFLLTVWSTCHLPRCSKAVLQKALMSRPIAKRLCRDPLDPESSPGWLLPKLCFAAGGLQPALLHAPDSSWLKFEEALRRADLFVENGFLKLLEAAPLLAVKSFTYFPGKLFGAAAALCGIPDGSEKALLMRFRRHPLMQQTFRRKPLRWVLEFLENFSQYSNPAPKRLQQYGLIPGALSTKRLRRYRKELYRNLNLTRLELLEDMIQSALRTQTRIAFRLQDPQSLYRLYAGAECNKRAIRRFLNAYEQGDTHYVLRHTQTRAWINRHPELKLTLWIQGIELLAELPVFGKVRVSVEQDPMEAWKLGTYAQSCLADGGCNQQYAAAVVLDINKRVVYARDSQQRVIARRLLALSEEGRLVCFAVYPEKADPLLKELLRKYCARFARALDLPIHRESKNYTIATILSRNWYDDGVEPASPLIRR